MLTFKDAVTNTSDGKESVHIIAPFHHARGGEWNMIDLHHDLIQQGYQVSLWSPLTPNKAYLSVANIHVIKPFHGNTPFQGTLIIGGCTTEIGNWVTNGKFNNVIVIHNEHNPTLLFRMMHRLKSLCDFPIEVKFVTEVTAKLVGYKPYSIQPHYPNSLRFSQFLQIQRDYENPRPFTIGRCSRDSLHKHHFRDPSLYITLRNQGSHIKLLGATCLAPWIKNETNIDLLPEMPYQQLASFFASIDCFYYRTAVNYQEDFGTVVLEAMLSGLPVVVHKNGGYSELISHGKNGFLFDSYEEAIAILTTLSNDSKLRKRIGSTAREPIQISSLKYN